MNILPESKTAPVSGRFSLESIIYKRKPLTVERFGLAGGSAGGSACPTYAGRKSLPDLNLADRLAATGVCGAWLVR